MNRYLLFLFCLIGSTSIAQLPDKIFQPNIHTVQVYKTGDPFSLPIIRLNSNDQLELHFDDMDADVKMYYYTFQLCNANWSASILHQFDYIKGFQDMRINTYRQSSMTFTRYTHYQALLPDGNCMPTKSGNYLLKVYLNGDTSQLAFTKRIMVVDTKASVAAQILQPFNPDRSLTYQKLQIAVQTNSSINSFSQQDLKVVVLQNDIWPSALYLDRPTIYRGNYFEYSDENYTSMPAGKEWRWIDLRSLRLMSDRMVRMEPGRNRTDVFVKPDGERKNQVYVYYRDIDGKYSIENSDNLNPLWQGDYAYVHFSYFPPGNKPYEGKNLYLFGGLTNYALDDSSKMVFNADKGAYEKIVFLKQGFYNYWYVTAPDKVQSVQNYSIDVTEGNYEGTENSYSILVYYRPFGARADELIGFATLNSLVQR
jgi:hypothetical protein